MCGLIEHVVEYSTAHARESQPPAARLLLVCSVNCDIC